VRLILNLLWLILGGFAGAVAWTLAGILCAVTIVGLPWARACLTLANYTLWPFGRTVVRASDIGESPSIVGGLFGLIGTILWIPLLGIWLAIFHVLAAIANAVTIIGLPFAYAHLKLAGASLSPIGMRVVPNALAAEAERRAASARLDRIAHR
jgi:uncharacterized membrane protein YccF (DUF307 family)